MSNLCNLSIKLYVFINKNIGVLSIFENNEPIGQITNVLQSYVSSYLLTENELFAARWSLKGEDNGSQNTPIVTNLIYANGKISIYYENNILQTPENKMLGMQGIFQCETGRTKHEIFFPAEWIRNGTLVEYEVIGSMLNLIYHHLLFLHLNPSLLFQHAGNFICTCSQLLNDIQATVSKYV
ncbi:hypothetical protein MS3_00000331 [Schistosoma haematobium]|uniref:Uncharacterized protein n=1 Tax=Schistosoma haematobium TaxID=6185 RepID=A0A922ISZ7_SCHHA|nr:hypothetical protein MS3_00000331 [Schistosoma haematobium]KAH9586078.1 hypothetical protein MS3_00000331 [Schistosoma haematobium]